MDAEERLCCNHPHVHELEQEGDFSKVVPGQEYVGSQHKVTRLHPKLEGGLRVPPQDGMATGTGLRKNT